MFCLVSHATVLARKLIASNNLSGAMLLDQYNDIQNNSDQQWIFANHISLLPASMFCDPFKRLFNNYIRFLVFRLYNRKVAHSLIRYRYITFCNKNLCTRFEERYERPIVCASHFFHFILKAVMLNFAHFTVLNRYFIYKYTLQ